MNDEETTVSGLIQAIRRGEEGALDGLFARVYAEVHRLARRQRRQWSGDETIDTTALVHEAYLKLAGAEVLEVEGRAHFLAIASRAMRQVLVNYAEARSALKRGGELRRISLSELMRSQAGPRPLEAETLVALDAALRELQEVHGRQAQVVECRFFGGMSIEETAAALGVSDRTVKRDWVVAQAWLHRRLTAADG